MSYPHDRPAVDSTPISHATPDPQRIARKHLRRHALLDAAPIPLAFGGVIVAFVALGWPVPAWAVVGGVLYGGLGILGAVEEVRAPPHGTRTR